MSYGDPALWFSWKGRINRRPYIFSGAAAGGLIKAFELIPPDNSLLVFGYLPILLIGIYIAVVLGIKRAHDRERPGIFFLLSFIPILNLWPLIELTFFRGTDGPNKFGEDPLKTLEM